MHQETVSVPPMAADAKEVPWRQRHRPALRAAAWFFVFFVVLAAITLFTGWASRAVTLFLQIALSLGAGFLAAGLHRKEGSAEISPIRMGALAGFYLPLAAALAMTLLAILVGICSLGVVIPLMVPYFAFLPIELGACSLVGALGAWLFQVTLGRI